MRRAALAVDGLGREYLRFRCPGCGREHTPCVKALPSDTSSNDRPVWSWNGNTETPTLQPSVYSAFGASNDGRTVCHSVVTDGQITFLADCTHALAGQTVPLPEVDE